jgi:inorganic pyrophosphatase
MVNPWHDISYGKDAPEEFTVIIEVPKDGKLKYELDKETGLMKLDRVLYSAVHYPGDYGFIPQTYAPDGDPVDVLIISNYPTYPNTIVRARPIGVLIMSDGHDRDDKIIAVHAADPRFNDIFKLDDMPQHMVLEIKHFFEIYKELQGMKVKILNLKGVEEAKRTILHGIETYKIKFPKKKVA